MNEALQYPVEFLQETVHMPSVCLVLPFEPQLYDKIAIIARLKAMLARAERKLLQFYSTNKALPVLTRMQQLIADINFSNYKKSIALLASPYRSQLYYLDFPVVETVRAGESLDIREVIKAKNKTAAYLVLMLDNHGARMYTGTATGLTCIKSNRETAGEASGHGHRFLHKIDQGLDLMLKAYGLPVFVLGQAASIDQFKQLTCHADDILAWLPGQFDPSDETAVLIGLQPELHQWNKHKHQFLLQKLHKAHDEGKLSCGIKEVWNTATHHRSQLLVVEDNFMRPLPEGEKAGYTLKPVATDPYQMKDQVDDIIEKVLKDGGDVEFVEQGALSDYQQIALIEFHQFQ